jgi:hypothetical protein
VFAHGAGQRPEVDDSVIADVDHLGHGYRRPSAGHEIGAGNDWFGDHRRVDAGPLAVDLHFLRRAGEI